MADLKFLYHPTLDIARSITEIHPYLEYLAAVRCKRQCVLLVVNLLQSLFRSAVQFEFHYINVLVGLQYKVYPALSKCDTPLLHRNPPCLKSDLKSKF